MSAGKTIIVPQGVIDPNTVTVIEIPAESQHESVFVANATQPQEPGMNCEYLYRSNIEVPTLFRPRVESSPLEDRPPINITETMDSSLFRNQMVSGGSGGSYNEGTVDYGNIWKPDYLSPVNFTGSNLSASMPLKLSSKTAVTHSGSNARTGGTPTRTMVTTTKLINLTAVDRPHDYYGSPQYLPKRGPRMIDSPESFNDLEYCDAQSTRLDGRDFHDLYSTVEDSEAFESGSMRTSMFKKVVGGSERRQLVMPMESPIAREGQCADMHGMPIGPSPPRSYYKQGRPGEHDQRIVSSITVDENSGLASGHVARGGRSFPGVTNSNRRIGGYPRQNATAGDGYAGTNQYPNTGGMGRTPRTPSPRGAPACNATGTICPAAAGNGSGGKYFARSPQTYSGQRSGTSGMASGNVTSGGLSPQSYDTSGLCSGSVCAGGTFCKSTALMGLYGKGASPQGASRPLNTTGPARSPAQQYSRKSPSPTPVGSVAYMQAVPPSQTAAANTTFAQVGGELNATFDARGNNAVARLSAPRTRTPSPGRTGPRGGPSGIMENMQDVLLSAEKEERRMVEQDLVKLQMERRSMLQNVNLDERALLRRNLFGSAYQQNKNDGRTRPRKQPKPAPCAPRPRKGWK